MRKPSSRCSLTPPRKGPIFYPSTHRLFLFWGRSMEKMSFLAALLRDSEYGCRRVSLFLYSSPPPPERHFLLIGGGRIWKMRSYYRPAPFLKEGCSPPKTAPMKGAGGQHSSLEKDNKDNSQRKNNLNIYNLLSINSRG